MIVRGSSQIVSKKYDRATNVLTGGITVEMCQYSSMRAHAGSRVMGGAAD
jgi:hypothetical protein